MTASFDIRNSAFGISPARRLAVMNLALRGIEADFGPEHADTFRHVQHPDLRADTATRVSANPKPRSHLAGLLRSERQLPANPPFNDSDWFRQDDDVRFFSLSASNGERAGVRCRNDLPPKGNANFAWVQHFIHHLAPQGMAGFVLANGSMSANQSCEVFAKECAANGGTSRDKLTNTL